MKNLFLKPILKQWPLSFVILIFPSRAWLHHLHNSSSSCCRPAASLLTSFPCIWKSPASQPLLASHESPSCLVMLEDLCWTISELSTSLLKWGAQHWTILQDFTRCLPMPPGLLFSPDWKSKNKRKPCQAYKATPLSRGANPFQRCS